MEHNGGRAVILVVDDAPENIEILGELLGSHYVVKVATNGGRALRIAQTEPHPDLILLDIMMPDMDGYEVCSRLKEDINTRQIPVIFVTAMGEARDEARGFEAGAADYITKPINSLILEARVCTHLALYDQRRDLEDQVNIRTTELQNSRLEIVNCLGRAAEYRDNETGLHVIRMSHYARILALQTGMSELDADLLFHATPMHDVGKIGIPDQILLKPGKLDADEWVLMQHHTEYGAEILGGDQSDLMQLARVVALTHHEKWNGQGYPQGLSGGEIPLSGRVTAVADVFDALTSKRPYKDAWPADKAVRYLVDQRGQHFDPELIPLFERSLPQVLEIMNRYADEQAAA